MRRTHRELRTLTVLWKTHLRQSNLLQGIDAFPFLC